MTNNTAPSIKRRAPWARHASSTERSVIGLLTRLDFGSLDMQMPDGDMQHFGRAAAQPRVGMTLHNREVFARVLASGDIGLAESYMDGDWDSSQLTELLVLLMRNRAVLERVVYGSALGSLLYRLRHGWRRNSRTGSRRNIEAHYDLGNPFYRLWLDPSMNYSSALFEGDRSQSLQQAQDRKVDRALDEARVRAGTRLLEIGCGWGALAERAAQRQALVTGVTLSHEQLDFAQQRLAAAGLPSTLRLEDYRDLARGPDFIGYDSIVSIEMFEAVGRAYWDTYFGALHRCLKQDGRACIQTITIRDDLFDRYVNSTDFIQQYVFPGGLLPSAQAFRAQAQRAGFVVEREWDFGLDYAETLHRWRETFLASLPQVKAQGFDRRFLKLWDFYLAYCEAAFLTGNTSVVQFTLRHA